MKGLSLCAGVMLIIATVGPVIGARELTVQERVKAQAEIERVSYAHQAGATRPFEEALGNGDFERKVRTYLKKSAALEKYWGTVITADSLRKEAARMARGSRMPERLGELRSALGDDPFLFQECLVRPILVDRLTRNFFAYDQTLHAGTKRNAEVFRDCLLACRTGLPHPISKSHCGGSAVNDAGMQAVFSSGRGGSGADRNEKRNEVRLEIPPAEFEDWRARLRGLPGEVGPVVEGRDSFAVHVLDEEAKDQLRIVSYGFRKQTWDEWWAKVAEEIDEAAVPSVASDERLPWSEWIEARQRQRGKGLHEEGRETGAGPCTPGTWDNGSLDDLPDPRGDHTAAWTGSVMIVWGGSGGLFAAARDSGATYDPAIDSWTPLTETNAPSPRFAHSAVWTGTRMIVWGGSNDRRYLGSGGSYDPSTETWTSLSEQGAPTPRSGHTSIWTGTRMIVWGGRSGNLDVDTGGSYDPATNRWSELSAHRAPIGRIGHTAVWTGRLMIVWGGVSHGLGVNTGGRYDPVTDAWTATSLRKAPFPTAFHEAAWTGTRMIVSPGARSYPGGLYDPVKDRWAPISTANAPVARWNSTSVWTGSVMIVWGGEHDSYSRLDDGARYDPRTDTWTALSRTNAPSPRGGQSAVWTGNLMIVWGGFGSIYTTLDSGARYDPASDRWTPTSKGAPPLGRRGHSAVWTGSQMILWGGLEDVYLATGGQYDPTTDSWTATSTTNAPSPRHQHTAVWTGDEMIVWGGDFGLNTGGRYVPSTDTWSPMSTDGAPSPMSRHTAVWTGREMVVWGEVFETFPYESFGARYDPASDTWAPISSMNAPAPRTLHSAVWTGSTMIVWGGHEDGRDPIDTGGRYDSQTDTWLPTSTTDVPEARLGHTAIWTGRVMVVWGGEAPGRLWTDSGGVYDPGLDVWIPVSLHHAPAPRRGHTAVWTGREMIVWGGFGLPSGQPLSGYGLGGGQYDPEADAWVSIPTAGAPSEREIHTAVWTGSEMIVWGGANISRSSSGGRYSPGRPVDGDGDGFSACQGDCDDADENVHAGAAEVCDGIDNDCSGEADDAPCCSEGDPDSDGLCGGFDVCPNAYDPDQGDFDRDGTGDACEVTITRRPEGFVASCSPDAIPPTIEWSGPFDRFQVLISWSREFSRVRTVSSGERSDLAGSWNPSRRQWRKVCANAHPYFFVKVIGTSEALPEGNPLRTGSDMVIGVKEGRIAGSSMVPLARVGGNRTP